MVRGPSPVQLPDYYLTSLARTPRLTPYPKYDPPHGSQTRAPACAAVGHDEDGRLVGKRALDRGIPTFVLKVPDFASREEWDEAFTAAVASYEPTIIVLAGFMKLVGKRFLEVFEGRTVNTHPALSPSFPGMHGPREALASAAKVTGCTL